MRLVFVYHDAPEYFGGPIINAQRLLPELVRRGHEVHCLLLYSGYVASNVRHLRDRGVHCRERPRYESTDRQVCWILEQVASIKPDAFIPNLSVPGCFAAHWVSRWGIPGVVVIRNADEFCNGLIEQFVVGPSAWRVSGVVCVSEGIAEDVHRRATDSDSVCVIPSGVPVPTVQSAQSGPLRLVYAGRLVQEAKRALDMVESIAAVLSRRTEITATLIGNGPQEGLLRERVRALELGHRIRLPGPVVESELPRWLAEHDVLVLLSDYEGTPGAVMDGMAAGLVPVCLDIPGGVRELVVHEQTGLLVKDRGHDFSSAIVRLAEDAELRVRLAGNARRHIERGFSLQCAADRWEAFLTKLIARRRSAETMILPKVLTLPAVHPALAHEDVRHRPLGARVVRTAVRAAKRGLHATGLKWW